MTFTEELKLQQRTEKLEADVRDLKFQVITAYVGLIVFILIEIGAMIFK